MRGLDYIRTLRSWRFRKAASSLRRQRRPQLISLGLSICGAAGLLVFDGTSANGARRVELQLESQTLEPERQRTSAANADTVWFAAWEFGNPTCDASGWTASDNRILNDGSIHWHMESTFDGQGAIAGQAAAVGYHDNACCVTPNGYDNDWYQAIRLTYTGAATLSFDYLVDSEQGFDWMQVETDSLCLSFDRVDYGLDPLAGSASFRKIVLTRDGLDLDGSITAQALTSYGPGSHCVYIGFLSDGAVSPCDGFDGTSTTIGEGVVVDNIVLADAGGTQSEDFEDGTLDIGTFVNLHDSEPFGLWARLHPHSTDNDVCTEVRDCAWIFSDPTLVSSNPDLRFGPGGAVIRNWLDNVVTSPWVSLPPGGLGNVGTILDFRFFGGNPFVTSQIIHTWLVRTRRPANGVECVSAWRSTNQNSLNSFIWLTGSRDLTSLISSEASAIQVRYRVADRQYITGAGVPNLLDPGPGPYLDRVRIGRRLLQGPSFGSDLGSHGQAQDNFPSVVSSSVPVQDFTPSTDRFGVADFSPPNKHLGSNFGSIYFKTRDSLFVEARDIRGTGGIPSVFLNGAIVSGPHAGKAPPPWSVGPNGFFQVPADSARNFSGNAMVNFWFADLDDRYFRGGDVLLYFWSATDAAGGRSSFPDGLSSDPASVAEAEAATQGLLEVSFLPTIDWDPAYLARIQADASGKLDPTPAELAASRQANCILYQRIGPTPRRSGPASRTAFTYTLDRLGYAGAYDVYDQLGPPVANSQVMSRASLDVAGGYALIVLDGPGSGSTAIPDGVIGGGVEGILDQSQWYQDWLAGASASDAGRATLWLVGRNIVQGSQGAGHVVGMECATTLVNALETLGTHPQVLGQTSFDWADGSSSDFSSDTFAIATGICVQVPLQLPTFDLVGATGTGVVTHRFASTMGPSEGAVVMNANAAADWNTVVMSFDWNWLGSAGNTPTSQVVQLTDRIVRAALADSCELDPDPATGFPDDSPGIDALPRQTALLPNVPNPFNPVTTIHFDLARDGQVLLRIHDVAGRTVRTLVQQPLARRHHEVVWDGADTNGRQVPSGIYFTRLHTDDGEWTRKLVVLR